jgi:hypothetical protein
VIGFRIKFFLPVGFMNLLIAIKHRKSVYDSPNLWFYPSKVFSSLDLLSCKQKPINCAATNYYHSEVNFDYDGIILPGYIKYGYIPVQQVQVLPIILFILSHCEITHRWWFPVFLCLDVGNLLDAVFPISSESCDSSFSRGERMSHKKGMKMIGLTDAVYNLSWLIKTVLQMTVVSILITSVTSTLVIQYSNKFFAFLYFKIFIFAIISTCFLLATFFSRSKTASFLGPMIFFASFFPYSAGKRKHLHPSIRTNCEVFCS